MNIHYIFIHKSTKLETVQLSWANKQLKKVLIYLQNGILLKKSKQNIDTYNNFNEIQNAECEKQVKHLRFYT